MRHRQGTVNVRINEVTRQRIIDKRAHFTLANQTPSIPTIDEVINAALDALESTERHAAPAHNGNSRHAGTVQS